MLLNRRIQQIIGSTTLAITARAKELKAQGHDVVNFGAGEPDFDTPDNIKQAAIKAIQSGFTKYTPTSGTPDLREAIAAKFKNENHLLYKPGQIVVSCGAKHSLYNIIQVLVDEGEEVLIPAPYWVSYPEMVKMSGGTPRYLPTGAKTQFKITPKQLEQSLNSKTKLLILNSPSNPTGMVYSRNELEALAAVCVQKKIYVLSDEIYEKLIYTGEEYVSIGSLGKEIFNLTVTVNGMSKAYSMTGWRIGYAAGPQPIMDSVKNMQDHMTSNPASISQAAALEALRSPSDFITTMRQEFQRRRDVMVTAMSHIPGVSCIKPEGAFYLFCDFTSIGNSEEIAKRILDDVKVAVIPGDGFGAPGFLRLSFATSLDHIQEGTRRIAQWVKDNAKT